MVIALSVLLPTLFVASVAGAAFVFYKKRREEKLLSRGVELVCQNIMILYFESSLMFVI